jgi:MinD superfamily P-loop ATPase
MRKVIIINGKGGVGKDTVIGITELLVNQPVYSITSIAVVKEAARILG